MFVTDDNDDYHIHGKLDKQYCASVDFLLRVQYCREI